MMIFVRLAISAELRNNFAQEGYNYVAERTKRRKRMDKRQEVAEAIGCQAAEVCPAFWALCFEVCGPSKHCKSFFILLKGLP